MGSFQSALSKLPYIQDITREVILRRSDKTLSKEKSLNRTSPVVDDTTSDQHQSSAPGSLEGWQRSDHMCFLCHETGVLAFPSGS